MAIDYEIDPATGVLTMTLSGDVTVDDFHDYFDSTAADPLYSSDLKRLVVVHDVRSFPKSADVRAVAMRIRSRTSTSSVLLALVSDSPLGRGMIAMIMGNAGLADRYAVFDDVTSAMVWLVSAAPRMPNREADRDVPELPNPRSRR
jgi:hypothetical protein